MCISDYHVEMEKALLDFIKVAKLANYPVDISDFHVEYLDAPHEAPSRLPAGKMAVYAFWWQGEWLKIGQLGPKSSARYTSQHYNPNGAKNTLARSLLNDPRMFGITDFKPDNPGEWIKSSTCRVNILLSSQRKKTLLTLLESFLHARFNPKYEG